MAHPFGVALHVRFGSDAQGVSGCSPWLGSRLLSSHQRAICIQGDPPGSYCVILLQDGGLSPGDVPALEAWATISVPCCIDRKRSENVDRIKKPPDISSPAMYRTFAEDAEALPTNFCEPWCCWHAG